jgi:tetratricopeptide (TPR) repeat protein/tRNA A-37 threonylcarbamoyl transferase component Bud32
MPCPDLEQLDEYLSGEIDLARRSVVEEHLASCDSCRGLLSELREQEEALSHLRAARSDAAAGPAEAPHPAIGGYEILRTIHQGGQGIVYAARQQSTRRLVAVKLLLMGRYATKRQRHRFEREIDLTAGLDHPNIVTVFDSGITDDGRLYLVMRYVEGRPLDEYVAARSLSIPQTLSLFVKVTEAVNYAHQRGVIHRDLKPSNILIDADGSPHLLDFGLAKHRHPIEDAQRSVETQAGEFIGTLAYAAPEQVSGDPHAVDVRSDVYSLGVMLFQMLTAAHPYPVTGRLAEVVRNISEAEAERPSTKRREIDDELDTIVAKTLSKEKERRYQSVADLLRDLERYRAGRPIEAKGDSTWYVLRKTLRRHRAPVAAAAAVFFVLILATIVSTGFWHQAVTDRRQAELEAGKVAAINEFLVGMLGSVHPVRQGKDVTVRQILDEAAATIDESFAGQPLIEAELRTTIGNTYRAIGLFAEAEPHLERAVDICRRRLGEEDPRTLRAQLSLAVLYSYQGRADEAEPMMLVAVDLHRQVLGAEHPDTLRAINALGLLLFKEGRYGEAEPLWEQVIELSRRTLGAEHLETLNAINNLGWLYLQQGRYEEAETTSRRAYEQNRRVLGEEHPLTLTAMSHLAAAHHRQGRYTEAESLYEQALQIQRRILGDEHPEAFLTSIPLGWLYIEQGRFDEAERFHLRELEIARRVLGEDHPGTLQYMNSLGVIYQQQGRYEESERLKARTLEIQRRVLGDDHPETLDSANNLAALYYSQDRLAEAEPLWVETLRIRRRVLGDEHPETLASMNNLGLLYQRQQRYEEAEAMYAGALEARRRTLGPFHYSTFDTMMNLASLYVDQGRYEEAETELLGGYEQFTSALGPGHKAALTIAAKLAALYEAWNRPGEAAKYRPLSVGGGGESDGR